MLRNLWAVHKLRNTNGMQEIFLDDMLQDTRQGKKTVCVRALHKGSERGKKYFKARYVFNEQAHNQMFA